MRLKPQPPYLALLSLCTIYRQLFVDQQRLVVHMTVEAKSAYFKEKLCNVDSKRMFKIVKDMTSAPCRSLPTGRSDKQLATDFSSFFKQKIDNIQHELFNTDNLNHNDRLILDSDASSSLSSVPLLSEFTPVSDEETERIIFSLANKSSCLDPWPTSFVREYIHIVLPLITRIVNASLEKGTFPDCLKRAIVYPLLKKASLETNELGNYRPVSNL